MARNKLTVTKTTTVKPQSVGIKRNGNTITATFKASSAQKKVYNQFYVSWHLNAIYPATGTETGAAVGINTTSRSYTLTRGAWYPVNSSRKLGSVVVGVRMQKGKAKSEAGYATIKFGTPNPPTVNIEYAETSGNITPTVTAAASTELRERLRTRFTVTREACLYNAQTGEFDITKTVPVSSYITGDSYTTTLDEQHRSVVDGEWVKWTVTAWSQGLAGDSAKVSKTIIISQPKRATFLAKRDNVSQAYICKQVT